MYGSYANKVLFSANMTFAIYSLPLVFSLLPYIVWAN